MQVCLPPQHTRRALVGATHSVESWQVGRRKGGLNMAGSPHLGRVTRIFPITAGHGTRGEKLVLVLNNGPRALELVARAGREAGGWIRRPVVLPDS